MQSFLLHFFFPIRTFESCFRKASSHSCFSVVVVFYTHFGLLRFFDHGFSGTDPGIAYRLVGNNNASNSGRVEVRVNGVWGTVCSRYWDRWDAGVMCKSQGFSDGDVIKVPSGVTRATGPVWSANLRCGGTESELNDCLHQGWQEDSGSYCKYHTQDAAAFCYTNGEH